MKKNLKHKTYKITIDRAGNFVVNKQLRIALGIEMHELAKVKVVRVKNSYGLKKHESGLPIKWFKNETRCRFRCTSLIRVLVKKYKIRKVFCTYHVMFRKKPIEKNNEKIFIIDRINTFYREQSQLETCQIN